MAVALAGLLLLLPASALAAFHLIKVREVYPDAGNDSYVVLQMYSTGERFVEGSSVTLYDSTGTLLSTSTFPSSVPNGANQQTILVGDSGAQIAFGVVPDLVDAGLNIPANGGAVCWASIYDCMSWGNFSGSTSSPTGSPADPSGISAGTALRRTIEPGCATLLESADDSNNSSADFFDATPNPRNNASAIVEKACPSLPNTTIGTKPANPTNSTSASFTFTATPAEGAGFECKLDEEPGFTSCTSPKAYAALGEAMHKFEVRAFNGAGTDPTPASHTWTVDLTAPEVTVLSGPASPNSGNSASFTYSPDESVSLSSYQCSLVPKGELDSFSSCPSTGKSYPDAQHPAPLADGEWTFKVRATDLAGNRSTPGPEPLGTYTWTVDNSLADTTPPETTILARPPDPSESSMASFAYASNEEGSTFECALDGGGFVPCVPTGIEYVGLSSGQHSFQVRATDGSGNTDPTPAGHSWQVALPALPPLSVLSPESPIAAPERPETQIVRGPRGVTRDRTPTFRFRSSVAGSSFQCKVDRGPFRFCHSPFTTKPLRTGRHAVRVRAITAGLTDPTPARARFKVVKPATSSRLNRASGDRCAQAGACR